MSDVEVLLSRIEVLESRQRSISWIAFALATVLVSFGVLREMRRVGTLEVRELVVKNESGSVVARLRGDRNGACLELAGNGKATTADLCASENYGSIINLNDGRKRTFLSAGARYSEPSAEVLPGLIISEVSGKTISLSGGEYPALSIRESGTDKAAVLGFERQGPTLRLVSTEGRALWTAPVQPK